MRGQEEIERCKGLTFGHANHPHEGSGEELDGNTPANMLRANHPYEGSGEGPWFGSRAQ